MSLWIRLCNHTYIHTYRRTQHSSAYLQLDLPISTMHADGQHSFVTTATRSSCAINKYQAAGYAECC